MRKQHSRWGKKGVALKGIIRSLGLTCTTIVVKSLSCVWLCDPMDCSTSSLSVLHYLLEFAQTHVHWVGDAIHSSHPLSPPSPPDLNLSQHQNLFQWVGSLHQVSKVLELQLHHQSFQWIFRIDYLCCCRVASVVSGSVRPHGLQPTRLFRPWDFPGKNTGVGCHFLLQCMKVESESEVAQSCLTLCDPMDCSLPGSFVHGIFQARVLEWVAIAFSLITFRIDWFDLLVLQGTLKSLHHHNSKASIVRQSVFFMVQPMS